MKYDDFIFNYNTFKRYMLRIFFVSFIINTSSVLAQSKHIDSSYITTSDSIRLFVKRSGSGYPVLFIHGGPASNAYYFEKEGGDVFSKDVQLI